MFFAASKILGLLIPASNILIFAALLGAALHVLGYRRIGRILVAVALLGFLACGFGPAGAMLLRPLEDRFAPPAAIAAEPTGIVVLGGGLDARISNARKTFTLSEDGSRLTTGVALALRYPHARLVFTGGSAEVFGGPDEATPAKRFFEALGIPPDRIVIESRSRNTAENALFTRDLVQPKPGQVWLLVTSAAHMPRAVGSFRRAGFEVVPYPASYRTAGTSSDFWPAGDASAGLSLTDAAMHEWVGLIAYRIAGKTNALLPGP